MKKTLPARELPNEETGLFPNPIVDASLQVPTEIMEAAHKVGIWAMLNGFHNWEIGWVADRKLVTKLRDALRRQRRRKNRKNETTRNHQFKTPKTE